MNLSFKIPNFKEFEQVQQFIKIYELDNRDLKAEEFVIALDKKKILGFGRLKNHTDCIELCSLGVIISNRKKGIGKNIIHQLLKNTTKEVFVVCIIPNYFSKFGFKETNDYPNSIKSKVEYCTSELIVPEKYVVMKLKQSKGITFT